MNIHIVHLPHTFPYLIDLSLAFSQGGFDSVTLIANGFNQDQIQSLRRLSKKHEFLNILDIPTKRVLSHGQALNYAFDHSQDELFCFADHDIFPTGPIINEIQSALQNYDVVCLGDRPENIEAEYKGFAASAIETQSGTPLATSFFSVFKRAAVELASSNFNVGFEQYFRTSQVPQSLVNHVDIQALREPFLVDTCKALSLALHQLGHKVKHLNALKVCHFGGLCGAINRFNNNGMEIVKEFIVKDLPSTEALEAYYQLNQQRHPRVLELKRSISDYSLQLLIALQQGNSTPQFICTDESLQKTINQIDQATKQIFNH